MGKFSKDPQGDRMKKYEACASTTLIDGTPKIIRLDGKAFHTWTTLAGVDKSKPFDERMMKAMAYAAQQVMKEIGGIARFAYIQSDECSIVLNDKLTIHTQSWFGNKIQKIVSVAASIMSVNFVRYWQENVNNELHPAYFDARVFEVPSVAEMHNAILWRQFDASKNSISQYARHYFSHKKLHGKNGSEMQEMMFQEHGFNWNDAPTWTKRGIIIYRTKEICPDDVRENINFFIPVTDENCIRTKWNIDWDIPMFNKEQEYLKDLYLQEKEDGQS